MKKYKEDDKNKVEMMNNNEFISILFSNYQINVIMRMNKEDEEYNIFPIITNIV